MYNWKEIALMYKSEVSRLYSDIDDCYCILEKKNPHCVSNTLKLLNHSLDCSSKEFSFIESFEDKVNEQSKKEIKKVNKVKNNKCGRKLEIKYELTKSDENIIEPFCSLQNNKKIYEFVDKLSVYSVLKWLDGFNYIIDKHSALSRKDNVIIIKDRKSLKEKHLKVVSSGMKFKGRTKPFNSNKEGVDVPLQHTYLIDPKETVYDVYIFVNYSNKDKVANIYARVNGDCIQKMLVNPLRERFVGKMACILQKVCYNKGRSTPLSIDEVLNN